MGTAVKTASPRGKSPQTSPQFLVISIKVSGTFPERSAQLEFLLVEVFYRMQTLPGEFGRGDLSK